MSNRKAVFDAAKAAGADFNKLGAVALFDDALDKLGVERDSIVTAGRTLSAHGLAHIKASEGLRLKAYPDPASGGDPWTIGYGSTTGAKPGMVITEAQAEEMLRRDVARFEAAVNKLAPKTTQGQFDAMVSFSFNVGEGNLAKSTLLKKHNAGDYAGAANEFGNWTLAAGKRMPGLVTRRAGEAKLYRGLS